MAAVRKVIITCAVTGSVHTPTMTPYLPITPDADRPRSRSPRPRPAPPSSICMPATRRTAGRRRTRDVFMQFLPRIKQNTDAVINITTGGSLGMSMEDRLAAPLRAKPELCSLNMGSMNFGIFHVTEKITDWKYDWEKRLHRQDQGHHRLQHLRADRALHPRARPRPRHPLRMRVLRRRPPLHAGEFPRPEAAGAAAVRADDLRHPGRHRRPSRGPDAHAPHRRPAVRQRLPVVDPGRRPASDQAGDHRRHAWAAMSASAWRTASISGPGGSPRATPSRSPRSASILEELSLEVATPAEARADAEAQGWRPGRRSEAMAAEIDTYRGVVYPWQCDCMGHMNTQFYCAHVRCRDASTSCRSWGPTPSSSHAGTAGPT